MRHATIATIPRAAGCAVWLLVASSAPAGAQIVINAGTDMSFKLGVLGQFQADTLEDPGMNANTKNLFVRRMRLLFGGQVAKHVTFFIETDAPNLGKTLPGGKNIQPAMNLQDAYAELKATDAFAVDAGLMYVPFSRNAIQSASTLLPIDYGSYTFTQSAPTQSFTGRDTGFQAKGYALENRLEYRVGAFQGLRDARSHNSFRYVGRAQYNFFDTETGFFYTGTYLGKKKILAVGAAFDSQLQYHAYDADVFTDYPLGPGAITAQFDYNRFDGNVTLPTLPKQNDVLLELGYLISSLKLTPVLQFVRRDVIATTQGDEKRVSIGANYWWAGHNANIKAAFVRIDPAAPLPTQKEFTVQLQMFLY